MHINLAITSGLTLQRSASMIAIDLGAVDSLPFTAPAIAGKAYVAGPVTLRVLAFRETGATADVPGTITAAGVVDDVTPNSFEAAVAASGAIAAAGERAQVLVLGVEVVTWTPAALGLPYWSLDGGTLWQDVSRTVPALVDGDPVRTIDDTVLGYHAIAPSDPARGLLRISGGKRWINFDGAGNTYTLPIAALGAADSDNYVCFGVRNTGNSYPYILGGGGDNGFLMLWSGTSGLILPAAARVNGVAIANGTTNTLNTDFVYSADQTRATGAVRGLVNNAVEANASGTPGDKLPLTTAAIGSWGNGSQFFKGRFYGGVAAATIPDEAAQLQMRQFMGLRLENEVIL